MVKWIAFVMAFIALMFAASADKVERLDGRVVALENRKCMLMVVSTPSGTATICADILRANQD